VGAEWFLTTDKDAVRLDRLGDLPFPIYSLTIKFKIVEGEKLWEEAILKAARGAWR
jgi:hypothetical protein